MSCSTCGVLWAFVRLIRLDSSDFILISFLQRISCHCSFWTVISLLSIQGCLVATFFSVAATNLALGISFICLLRPNIPLALCSSILIAPF